MANTALPLWNPKTHQSQVRGYGQVFFGQYEYVVMHYVGEEPTQGKHECDCTKRPRRSLIGQTACLPIGCLFYPGFAFPWIVGHQRKRAQQHTKSTCCKSRPRESFAGSDEILFPLPDSNAIAIPVLPFNSPEHEKPTWWRFERIQKLKTEIEVDDHDCSLLSCALSIARLLMDIQNPDGIFNRLLRLSLLSCLL